MSLPAPPSRVAAALARRLSLSPPPLQPVISNGAGRLFSTSPTPTRHFERSRPTLILPRSLLRMRRPADVRNLSSPLSTPPSYPLQFLLFLVSAFYFLGFLYL